MKSPTKLHPFTLLTSSSPACWMGSTCPSERWVWEVTASGAGGTGRRTGSPRLDWRAGRAGSARWTRGAVGSPCWRHRNNRIMAWSSTVEGPPQNQLPFFWITYEYLMKPWRSPHSTWGGWKTQALLETSAKSVLRLIQGKTRHIFFDVDKPKQA